MLPKARFSTFAIPNRARGEIGRHATLRGWCPYGCGSSNLLVRTPKIKATLKRVAFFDLGLQREKSYRVKGSDHFSLVYTSLPERVRTNATSAAVSAGVKFKFCPMPPGISLASKLLFPWTIGMVL